MFGMFLTRVWDEAELENRLAVTELVGPVAGTLLDCGCGDGAFTSEVRCAAGPDVILGLEIDAECSSRASARGIRVSRCDLNGPFPIPDSSVDALFANQVIEHLHDTDNLMAEGMRVLKAGGVMVVSTENLSSWHNIFALVLGWQPFSLTNISGCALGVGNPLALHRNELSAPDTMRHLRIFTPRSLVELAQEHGFEVERLVGVGYFPLPGRASRFMSRLDTRHSAFITIKAMKPHVATSV